MATHDWNSLEIKLGKPSGVEEILAVVEEASSSKLKGELEGRPQALKVLERELKKVKGEDPKKVRVPFEGRGGLTVLVVNSDLSSFKAQTFLRKSLLDLLKADEESKELKLSLRGLSSKTARAYLDWIVALALIARYRSPVFGVKASEQKALGRCVIHVDTALPAKEAQAIIDEALALGFANNQVRHLAELPSNILHPASYRERAETLARELSKKARVKCSFLGKKELEKRGAGAFLAVVQGDHHERAGIVHLQYSPAKGSKKKVALVGKGLCFDTGGYNVKTGDFMNGMHQDMTGSAIVLSLFQVLVTLKVPYEVHAYLALAENLIAFDAYRPNDVVVASNGLSIEVENTDAEGRMCLSDTLAIASKENPDLMIDFATLTGSVIRSIDTRRCGVYSTDLDLSTSAVRAGEACGERVWNFPIGEDYSEYIKSEFADLRQCSTTKAADHIYAATFLSRFVEKGIPWLHVDLAASNNSGGLGLVPTETTGFGVRFGLQFIRQTL